MESVNFNENLDRILIDLVRNYPELYNPQQRKYKDNTARENTWIKIAETLKKTGK